MLKKSVSIKGASWVIEVLSSASYKKKHGTDSEGITLRHDKKIHIDAAHFTQETLRHELFHSFVTECYGHMLDLTAEQMEELACEITSYHCDDISALSEHLYSTLSPKLKKTSAK